MKTRTITFLFLCAAYFLCASHPALAHKVNVFAYLDGSTVYTESYFSDGRPVIEGKIEVMDDSKQLLLQGTTNKQGFFNFPLPTHESPLIIVLDAAMGHKNSFTLKQAAKE